MKRFGRYLLGRPRNVSQQPRVVVTDFLRDELEPERKVLGDVAEVIRTTSGYQILKVESRTDTKIRTFEEARNVIVNRVVESKQRAALQKYLDGLREAASGADAPLMEPTITCVEAGATVGEISDALREVWGEYDKTKGAA